MSLFTTLFTAFSQALTRHEGANAVVLGTAVENRPPGHEDTVGAFASIIPVVVERRPGELPEATLRRTNGALREAMDHSAVPLPDIVQAVGGPAGRGDGAVVRAAFSMHQRTNREVRLGGAHARVQLGVFNGAARFPVDVVAFTSGTGDDTRVELLMEAQDGAVDRDDLWALWTHTLDWLRTWVQLLPTTRSPSVPTLVERVRARATTDPNAVALDDGTHQVTYGRLAALGESVRHIVGRPGRSWVCWGRRPRTSSPAPTPSCTPAGPIFRWRPDSPAAQLAALADQARCGAIVRLPGVPDTLAEALDRPDGPPWRLLDWAELSAGRPPGAAPPLAGHGLEGAAPACVLVTSGSTGDPKGVMVPRPALDRLADWAVRELRLGPATVVGQLADAAFGASAFDVWSALYAGARVRFAPAEVRPDPEELAAWLAEAGVEYAFVPTPIAELLARVPKPAGSRLSRVSTGGDRLHALPADVPFEVLNMYGAPETTVVATAGWIQPGGSALPSIGRPLPYGYVRVVTASGAPAAPGEPGELWVGGDGVAAGYTGAPGGQPPPSSPTRTRRTVRSSTAPATSSGSTAVADCTTPAVGTGSSSWTACGSIRVRSKRPHCALRQPGVVQAVALISVSRTGPRPHLFLILATDADPDRAARAVRADLPARLGHLTIHHLDALPRTAGGKVDQRLLTDLAERGRPHTTGPAGHTGPPRAPAPRPVNGAGSTDLGLLLPMIAPLPRTERLSLVHQLIGSVLSDKETR